MSAISKPTPRGLDAAWERLADLPRQLAPRRAILERRRRRIGHIRSSLDSATDAALRDQIESTRGLLRRRRDDAAIIDRAIAIAGVAAGRSLGLSPFPVQILGAVALGEQVIIEMATGEGKTLVAALAGVVEGWRGRGCHVVTVNDYLAQRDAEWMQPLYSMCGLRAAHLCDGMPADDRRAAYRADLTYGSSKELAADYLRDVLALDQRRTGGLARRLLIESEPGGALLQRGLECAIVDEADSVLIDEAVTPLILSSAARDAASAEAFERADLVARRMQEGTHYLVDHGHREVRLTKAGRERCQAEPRIAPSQRLREELLIQALTAQTLFHCDQQYIIQNGKLIIVDEFTGRLMPDRQWKGGLHQAIEAKERLEVREPSETVAQISFQRFFGLYRRLSGMTGTAREARGELWRVYRRHVVRIPTHRPVRRAVRRDLVHRLAVVEEVRRARGRGQAVLVGTRSVRASDHLSGMLGRAGIEHEVLNAVRAGEEARIVAGAGESGRVTIATNMAGRGTDIRLDAEVAMAGGLHVIATERHESRRVDRQLFGRCGRQGDPGSAVSIVSVEDDLIQRFGRGPIAWLALLLGMPRLAMRISQHRAQHVARRQRWRVRRGDDWLDDALGFAGARR